LVSSVEYYSFVITFVLLLFFRSVQWYINGQTEDRVFVYHGPFKNYICYRSLVRIPFWSHVYISCYDLFSSV